MNWKNIDALLSRAAFILLVCWAIWFTRAMGIKPSEIGTAIKTFNATFGPALPDASRKSLPAAEATGEKPTTTTKEKK